MSKTKSSKPQAESLYSHHVFLFPFKWAPIAAPGQSNDSFVAQTALDPLVAEFRKMPKQWRSKAFEINTLLGYSEYNYFLDYVREILYDLHEDPAPGSTQSSTSPLYSTSSGTKDVIQHFEYVPTRKRKLYRIKVHGRYQPYELEVESFFLHLYYTGVGVISFHLNNRRADQSSPEDILAINQFGRRVYPIYFDIAQEFIGTPQVFKDQNFEEGLAGVPGHREQGAQREVLAEYIEVVMDDDVVDEQGQKKEQAIREDFSRYRAYENFKHSPFLLPRFIEAFLPSNLFATHDNLVTGPQPRYTINPALDDRMFVVCWYGNAQLSTQLREIFRYNKVYENGEVMPLHRPYESMLDWWYKYVFVNAKTMTCQNAELRWKGMHQSTNLRWRDQGTFYGVTAYSLVMLTTDLTTLKASNRGFLLTYLQSIYYKLVELVLVQRATVERFADEVTHLSRLESKKELSLKVSSLYKQYIRFVNKIYFREVTAQALGSELYDALQEQSSVGKNVKDLDVEIQELHAYVQQTQERKRSQRTEQITSITAAFLGPSLLIGAYGINVYPKLVPDLEYFALLWLLLCSIATGYLASRIFQGDNGNGWRWRLYTALVPFMLGLIFPLLAPWINHSVDQWKHPKSKTEHSNPVPSSSSKVSPSRFKPH